MVMSEPTAPVEALDPAQIVLIEKLVQYMKAKGLKVNFARLEGYQAPKPSQNITRVGDLKDKQPDVYAVDPRDQTAVRGIAKISRGDLLSDHTRTQLLLFSRLA